MVVGLTGGIGSGKSTVAGMLAAHGATIVDTDAIAREVVEPPSPVLDAIHYEFGPTVLTPDGRLDREAMARIVFADPRQRELLNRLTHPEIRERTLARIQELPAGSVVVVVVPLLFESGFDELCDTTVAVIADPDMRRSRVAQRDQMKEEAVAARMSAQLADDEYARRARFVINNDGDIDRLTRQVDAVWHRLAAG
ncbi:MAG TPA: dephospho-CoA kinase [Magnetospirillaceae bacterium]|nr:dephospho-CoA kinase [Magnetospirillaceae bacterium]